MGNKKSYLDYIIELQFIAQEQAKRSKKGLWREKNPINPYKWGRKIKKRKTIDFLKGV